MPALLFLLHCGLGSNKIDLYEGQSLLGILQLVLPPPLHLYLDWRYNAYGYVTHHHSRYYLQYWRNQMLQNAWLTRFVASNLLAYTNQMADARSWLPICLAHTLLRLLDKALHAI